jgi:hypothetical protein
MTRNAKTPPPIDPIEQDFLDALDRLEGGVPLDPKLAKQAKLGTLKINVSVVAQEAGHSRTLIGHDGCKYPRIRTRITTLKAPITPTTNAETVIRHLREENAELRRKLVQRDTENAALIVRLRQLEIDTQRALRKAERMANRSEKPSDQLAGASIPSERGEILPFPTPQEE